MTPGEKIRRLLVESRRSQRWLAGRVRMSANAMNKIIAGGDTSVQFGIRISNVLDVSTDWLWSDADWPEAGPAQSADSPRQIVKIVTTVTETYFE